MTFVMGDSGLLSRLGYYFLLMSLPSVISKIDNRKPDTGQKICQSPENKFPDPENQERNE